MEDSCERQEDVRRLRQLLDTLPARERQILLLRYGLAGQPPLTQLETAGLLGISRSYVSRLETHALELLRQALLDALGAEAGAAPARPAGRQITYTDLYEWGLSGKPGSAERKVRLLNALGLPPRLSKKELVEAFNRLYTFEQLDELQLKILQE